jgi:hypothetical protein
MQKSRNSHQTIPLQISGLERICLATEPLGRTVGLYLAPHAANVGFTPIAMLRGGRQASDFDP